MIWLYFTLMNSPPPVENFHFRTHPPGHYHHCHLLHEKIAFFRWWFWYLGTLIPVIGLIQVGTQGWPTAILICPLSVFPLLAWGILLLFWRINIREKILFLQQ